jgi:hypothetical protein
MVAYFYLQVRGMITLNMRKIRKQDIVFTVYCIHSNDVLYAFVSDPPSL